MSTHLHYFITAHIPQEASFYEENLGSFGKIIPLDKYRRPDLEAILSEILKYADNKGYTAEVIHNCLDNRIQGLIFPEQSIGLYGKDTFHPPVEAILQKTRELYLTARKIHDEQEKVYIAHMDFNKADEITREAIDRLPVNPEKDCCPGKIRDRFFGAATVKGNLDYIANLTEDLSKRYFIKGRPGTGKSTALKKISASAAELGHNVEQYHCAFAPDSLDMIILRNAGICFFDSTFPHEYFPCVHRDEILDFYGTCVTPGTDEKYQPELESLEENYQLMLREGRKTLREANVAYEIQEEELLPLTKKDVTDLSMTLIETLF